jgi:hypothetical protein
MTFVVVGSRLKLTRASGGAARRTAARTSVSGSPRAAARAPARAASTQATWAAAALTPHSATARMITRAGKATAVSAATEPRSRLSASPRRLPPTPPRSHQLRRRDSLLISPAPAQLNSRIGSRPPARRDSLLPTPTRSVSPAPAGFACGIALANAAGDAPTCARLDESRRGNGTERERAHDKGCEGAGNSVRGGVTAHGRGLVGGRARISDDCKRPRSPLPERPEPMIRPRTAGHTIAWPSIRRAGRGSRRRRIAPASAAAAPGMGRVLRAGRRAVIRPG